MRLGVNTLFWIPGQVGGSETYLLEILRVWKTEGRPERVVLFTQKENHASLETEFAGGGWSCERLDFRAENRVARILWEQLWLPGRVRRAGVDALWSPGYTAPLFCPTPQGVSLLDMQYRSHPDDLTWLARLTTDVLVRAAARRAQALLTISEFSKSEILRHTRATPERITVTPLAASPLFAHAEPPPSSSRPYLLCVANTYPHKNVDQLVRAFGPLCNEFPHDLVLVGRPRLGEPRVQAALHELPDPSRVRRLSGLGRGELASLYAGADLFVFPSLYEGFGLPVLEAMSAGIPVLTTRLGSLPEVGGDRVDYYDATHDEALTEALRACLLRPPEERARRVSEARKRAATFDWSRTAAGTRSALAGVAAGLESGASREQMGLS